MGRFNCERYMLEDMREAWESYDKNLAEKDKWYDLGDQMELLGSG